MAKGIQIHCSLFKEVTDALEAADIEYSVFNAEVMMIDGYDGLVELSCSQNSQWERFFDIVQKFNDEKKAAILFNDIYTLAFNDVENSAMTLSEADSAYIILMIKDESFRNRVIARLEKDNSLES